MAACVVLVAGIRMAWAQESVAPFDPKWTLALSACMEKVMPMPSMSPVDIGLTNRPFTPAKEGALHDCMLAKGYNFGQALADAEPVSDKDVEDDWAAHAQERARSSEDTRAFLNNNNLEKYFPAEGQGHLMDTPGAVASMPRLLPDFTGTMAGAQPASQGAISGAQADADQAPQEKQPSAETPAAQQAVAAPSSPSLFVPSNNSGPNLIFLH